MWRPLTLSEICQGQEWGWAFSPFTTLLEYGRFPQPVKFDINPVRCVTHAITYRICATFSLQSAFTHVTFLRENLKVEVGNIIGITYGVSFIPVNGTIRNTPGFL